MDPIKILGTVAGIGVWMLAALLLDSALMLAAVPPAIIMLIAFEYSYRQADAA